MPTPHGVASEEGEAPETTARGRPVAVVQLIATAALAFSTLVAVTAVSIGIARADVLGAHPDSGSAPLAIAVLVALLLSGMGGLTALMSGDRRD
jgi:hypothetical protein